MGNPSPAEIYYQRKVRTDHMHAFGSICLAYIPTEKRNFKLEPVRIRCRLLGYADDDEVEIMDGYILLKENTRKIFYSKDVIFLNEVPAPLSGSEEDHLEELHIDDEENQSDNDYLPSDSFSNVTSTDISGDTIAESFSPSHLIDMDQESIDRSFPETRSIRRQTIFNGRVNALELADEDNIEDTISENESEYAAYTESSNGLNQHYEGGFITDISSEIVSSCYRTSKNDSTIPKNYHDMLKSHESTHWKNAIETEMKNMISMGVWNEGDITDKLPNGERAIDSTWVFAKKNDDDGKFQKFKARLCGRGFREIYELDYEEVFAPTVRQKVVRTICAIAASKTWTLFSDDMKSAYLNVILKEGRWLKLPNGKYVKIHRALYGLKESARLWFQTFRDFLTSIGFTQSIVEPCVFIKEKLIVAIFVDDTLSTGPIQEIQKFRTKLHEKFKISKNGGICKKFLSISMIQGNDGIKLCQNKYLEDKLELFAKYIHANPDYQVSSPLSPKFQEMLLAAEESNEIEKDFPYREMVGSLVYLANGTRFDIAAALSIVSRFSNCIKQDTGNSYQISSLRTSVGPLSAYLSENIPGLNGRRISIHNDDAFFKVRRMLDAVFKDGAKKGLDIGENKSVFSIEQERIILDSFDCETPIGLLEKTMFIISKFGALRGQGCNGLYFYSLIPYSHFSHI
jgi:hypothetical protein